MVRQLKRATALDVPSDFMSKLDSIKTTQIQNSNSAPPEEEEEKKRFKEIIKKIKIDKFEIKRK